jgi:hypothetical protein
VKNPWTIFPTTLRELREWLMSVGDEWLLVIGAALLLTVSGLTVIASGQVYLVLLDIRDDLREIYLDK